MKRIVSTILLNMPLKKPVIFVQTQENACLILAINQLNASLVACQAA
jgi:hypothetical protein